MRVSIPESARLGSNVQRLRQTPSLCFTLMALQNLLVLAVLWWQPCGLLVWLFCFADAFLMNESMQKTN